MAFLDLYRKYMTGTAGVDGGQGTQGLFGQGGQSGAGGLIDFQKMNNQEGGLLNNIPQSALLGSAIFGQGLQGKDPFSALLPAVTQTAQLQQMLTPEKKERKIVKAADGFNYYEDTGDRVLPGVQNKSINEKSRILSPEEVKKAGFKAGSIVQEDYRGNYIVRQSPTAEDLKKRTQYENTIGLLDGIEKRYYSLNKPVGGIAGFGFDVDRIKGQAGRLTGSKKGKEYSKLTADIDKTTTFLTQAISGAAVSEQEASRIKKLIPQLDDTEVVFEAKLESLKKYLNDARINHGGDISKHMESVSAEDYYSKSRKEKKDLESMSNKELEDYRNSLLVKGS